jgi:hypothetical protein
MTEFIYLQKCVSRFLRSPRDWPSHNKTILQCKVSPVRYFFSMAPPANSGPWPLIQFRNHFSQTVGILGRVISQSQGLYLNTEQHKHGMNAYTHTPNIHVSSGIRTHDPRVRANKDSSCLRPRGYCDRPPVQQEIATVRCYKKRYQKIH